MQAAEVPDLLKATAGRKSAYVILNRSSGSASDPETPGKIQSILERSGWSVTVECVSAGTDLKQLARQAAESGFRRIVAAGGDGTLRAVAEALRGSDAEMAILPVGTLNHFARDLQIPLELEEAVEVAGSGSARLVDTGEVNGNLFLNNVVIGLYPDYFFNRRARERTGYGKVLAKIAAAANVLWRYPSYRLSFLGEAGEIRRTTPYVLVANNAHAMEGLRPWERKSLTEGRLWVYVLRDRSRFALVRSVARLAAGDGLAYRELDVLAGASVEMETRRRRLGVSVDGEVFRIETPLRFRSVPGSLWVVAPAETRLESGLPVSPT